MKVAIIGTGIAGLSAAWLLDQVAEITVFEQAPIPGGHARTVDVPGPGGARVAVDTGFIVYNEASYPNLIRLFDHLGVETQASDMSFAVSVDHGRLEYAAHEGSLRGLFVQWQNLFRPTHYGMLRDILRFFRSAPKVLDDPATADLSLGRWLVAQRFGRTFVEDHLLAMAAAIWSAPKREIRDFPVRSFVRFFANHGLLRLAGRPIWRTVTGGSRHYVRRIADALGDRLHTGRPATRVTRADDHVLVTGPDGQTERFDQVVIATHSDQALAVLDDPSDDERALLGAIRYQTNQALLHGDPRLMPTRRGAWASWNYLSETGQTRGAAVSVTYWMNRLQSIDQRVPLFVSLNPLTAPNPDQVFLTYEVAHPILDITALGAQVRLKRLQGRRRTWFCGAWFGFGFHEDGLSSGLAVAEALGAHRPWGKVAEVSPAGANARPEPGAAAAA